ncbi:hypothetical protein BT67DRAFT_176156 [Trichocladium antarcticum]|uniref:Uncharacterized protein n=1 Tax=Trichocladium antarcticum TaxID=1450529 RepID=A0AAN6ZG37_9PEZI|nr:hypothetical protein BT67DRAFT_176156 [Trichocladium antarcticum]
MCGVCCGRRRLSVWRLAKAPNANSHLHSRLTCFVAEHGRSVAESKLRPRTTGRHNHCRDHVGRWLVQVRQEVCDRGCDAPHRPPSSPSFLHGCIQSIKMRWGSPMGTRPGAVPTRRDISSNSNIHDCFCCFCCFCCFSPLAPRLSQVCSGPSLRSLKSCSFLITVTGDCLALRDY